MARWSPGFNRQWIWRAASGGYGTRHARHSNLCIAPEGLEHLEAIQRVACRPTQTYTDWMFVPS